MHRVSNRIFKTWSLLKLLICGEGLLLLKLLICGEGLLQKCGASDSVILPPFSAAIFQVVQKPSQEAKQTLAARAHQVAVSVQEIVHCSELIKGMWLIIPVTRLGLWCVAIIHVITIALCHCYHNNSGRINFMIFCSVVPYLSHICIAFKFYYLSVFVDIYFLLNFF